MFTLWRYGNQLIEPQRHMIHMSLHGETSRTHMTSASSLTSYSLHRRAAYTHTHTHTHTHTWVGQKPRAPIHNRSLKWLNQRLWAFFKHNNKGRPAPNLHRENPQTTKRFNHQSRLRSAPETCSVFVVAPNLWFREPGGPSRHQSVHRRANTHVVAQRNSECVFTAFKEQLTTTAPESRVSISQRSFLMLLFVWSWFEDDSLRTFLTESLKLHVCSRVSSDQFLLASHCNLVWHTYILSSSATWAESTYTWLSLVCRRRVTWAWCQ